MYSQNSLHSMNSATHANIHTLTLGSLIPIPSPSLVPIPQQVIYLLTLLALSAVRPSYLDWYDT